MVAARDALKAEQWDAANQHLVDLQRLVHGIRLDIRDKRIPSMPPDLKGGR